MPLLLLILHREIQRRQTSALLEKELPTLRVVSVPDAESARNAARVQAPDLIVCERALADGDGSLLLTEFKRQYPEAVGVLITPLLPGWDLPSPSTFNVDAVLPEPFEPSQLVEQVAQALGGPADAPPDHGAILTLDPAQRHKLLNLLSRMLVCVRGLEADLRAESPDDLSTIADGHIDTIVRTINGMADMVARPVAHPPEGT